MPRNLRIYIAGPYTATEPMDLERNTKSAIDVGIALLKMGHTPFIPHLPHYVDLRAKESNIDISWSEYMRWDEAWLRQCDALLYLAPSRGADIELQTAQSLGKTIFYHLDEVPRIAGDATSTQRFASQK